MPKSLKAEDVMTKEAITIGPEATLAETIKKLIENKRYARVGR
jgi:CBS domain-containing protein